MPVGAGLNVLDLHGSGPRRSVLPAGGPAAGWLERRRLGDAGALPTAVVRPLAVEAVAAPSPGRSGACIIAARDPALA